jgi:predicted phage terminase large subunit-like protein
VGSVTSVPALTTLAALGSLTDEEILALPPQDQLHLGQALETQLLLRSPADFAAGLSNDLWHPYHHLRVTSEAIRAMVEDDTCDLLLIDQPVRHGKTELCSRWTPAWYIAKTRRRVLLASYEADFASTHGRKAREILLEHGPRFGIEIDATSRAAHRWELTNADGGMGTAGAGGPITGKGGHLLIVDDPIKNVEEAQSQVMRDHLWEWWQSVFLTRREPGGKVLLIMSRWHEDDLIARLLRTETGMRLQRLRMPAIAEDDDPVLHRRPGDALCPERYDEAALDRIRVDVGPNAWASLYQQRPISVGGGMFRRDRFGTWSEAKRTDDELLYRLGETIVDDAACWRFATMDPAFTRSKRSDFTAMAVWAVAPTDPPSLMLLDLARIRVEHADHAPLVQRMWERWRPAWVGIEKQMATLSLFDEVQRKGVVVRWLNPDRNKIARAETAVALVDSGRVHLPAHASWLPDFLDEVVSFPVAAHDDQVDVLAYACAELARRTVHPRVIRTEPQTSADKAWAQLEKRAKRKHLHPVLGRFN